MNTILADAAAGAPFWQVVEHAVAAAAVVSAIIMWLTYRRKRENVRIEPDPIRTRRVESNVKEPACLERRMHIEKKIDVLETYTKTEVGRIHDKIDLVERRMGDKLAESMDGVNETLRQMPSEIIKLLHATGQLKDHHD